jgi:hypothetical protein
VISLTCSLNFCEPRLSFKILRGRSPSALIKLEELELLSGGRGRFGGFIKPAVVRVILVVGVAVFGVAVFGGATVFGGAIVFGVATVFGGAIVFGVAKVFGGTTVFGVATVFGVTTVFGGATVFGGTTVFGGITVFGGGTIVFGGANTITGLGASTLSLSTGFSSTGGFSCFLSDLVLNLFVVLKRSTPFLN